MQKPTTPDVRTRNVLEQLRALGPHQLHRVKPLVSELADLLADRLDALEQAGRK